jgi:hypothetical protein
MTLPEDPRDEKAILALVAASIHPFQGDAGVTEEDVAKFLETCRSLTKEEEEHVKRIVFKGKAREEQEDCPPSPRPVTPELAAMHREKTDAQQDPETEAELEKKRAEIRERLKKKREGQ